MKYSNNFIRDFNWYLSMRHLFSFDGKIPETIKYDPKGIDGKQCFHKFDSTGKLLPTKHPNLVACLLRTKGSVNLHIKMYAEDRANGVLPGIIFDEMCEEFNVPEWFRTAVENQCRSIRIKELNRIQEAKKSDNEK